MRHAWAALAVALAAIPADASVVTGTWRAGIERRSVTIDAGSVSIHVTGSDRDNVVARLQLPEGHEGPRPLLGIQGGFERISVQVLGSVAPGIHLSVQLPIDVDLRIRTSNAGPVVVESVVGEIDVSCSNASVELIDVGGSATVATSNGSITAHFGRPIARRPMSFVTSNGAVDVTLPESYEGMVFMETDNGELTSDFEIRGAHGVAVDRFEMRGARRKVVRQGVIGNGARSDDGGIEGPQSTLRLRTDNNSIHLRSRP